MDGWRKERQQKGFFHEKWLEGEGKEKVRKRHGKGKESLKGPLGGVCFHGVTVHVEFFFGQSDVEGEG